MKQVVILVLLGLVVPGTGLAVEYTYTRIADNSDVFAGFFQQPSINNSGTVAFTAGLNAGGYGVYTGNGQTLMRMAASNAEFSMFSDPAINDAGAVAFRASLAAGGQGIFKGDGGALTTIADTSGVFTNFCAGSINPSLACYSTPAINSNGQVAFVARINRPGAFAQGVFVGDGGAVSTISDSSGPLGEHSQPAINASGTVAFFTYSDNVSPGIFTGTGGPLTTIANQTNFPNLSGPSINHAGTVAFIGSDAYGFNPTLIKARSGVLSPVGDLTPFNFPVQTIPSINSRGAIAFLAALDSQGCCAFELGLYVADDSGIGKVVAPGDALDGSTVVTTFDENGRYLNDQGQVAFYARLTDGREGIYLATPVPEPAVYPMLLTGLGFLIAGIGRLTRSGGSQPQSRVRLAGQRCVS